MVAVGLFAAPPVIERMDVLGAKIPGCATVMARRRFEWLA